MKLIIIFTLLSFSLVSCRKDNNKNKDDSPEEGIKIQQNSSFITMCDHLYYSQSIILNCPKGKPVCGTKPEQSKLEGYCIDENNILLSEAACIVEADKSHAGNPRCKELEENTANIKIQKNSNFRVKCPNVTDTVNHWTHYPEVECEEGIAACGTKPGTTNIVPYCIDTDDVIISNPSCSKTKGYTDVISPACRPLN